jgi:putative ABC transport system permease protein
MIGFLIKGLLRDRSRSLFPFLTVLTGVTVTVFMQAYLGGMTSNMGESSAAFSTGHLRVTSKAYAREGDSASNELAYVGVAKLLDELRTEAPELVWTPRIRFSGLIDVPDERGETRSQAPMIGMGVDLLRPGSVDRRLMKLDESIIRGRLPAAPGEVLISDDLARHLEIEPGARATLISSTMNGGMATSNFTVAGTVRFGIQAMDRGTMLADIGDVQRALDMEDASGEILGIFPDGLYRRDIATTVADRVSARWDQTDDEFGPTVVAMHRQPGTAEMLDYLDVVAGAIVAIFTVVMSIVLWNAGLIGTLRRYGEVGLRLAFGEDKGRLYRSMIAESLVIGLAGSIAGTLVGLIPAYWLQSTGFDVGAFMPNSTLVFNSVIRAQVTLLTFFIGFIPGLLATGIGTAISGIGIYKRQTATLIKELET